MEITVLLALTGIAGLFMIANSFSTERNNLYPAAAILMLAGFFLVTTPAGLQIESGTEYQYTEVNNETVIDQETTTYQPVEFPVGSFEFSNILGLIYLAISSGFFVMASTGRKIRSLFNR